MLCRRPYIPPYGSQRAAYPCKQCMPCRLNRRREWTSRILLESFCHEKSSFVTLTYAPEFVPEGNTLVPKHPSDFLKKLRHHFPPKSIRYYLVGEYGDQTERPHYHLALFGVGPESQDLVARTWGMGHVLCGDLTPESAQYVAGYVTKKMTHADDPRLDGRYPEFARMSLKPGIGSGSLETIARALNTGLGSFVAKNAEDVPSFLRFGDKTYPLGRYLRTKLRVALDFYKVDPVTGEVSYGAPASVLQKSSEEMSTLFDDWFNNEKASQVSFKEYLTSLDAGKVALMESKFKRKHIRRKL